MCNGCLAIVFFFPVLIVFIHPCQRPRFLTPSDCRYVAARRNYIAIILTLINVNATY